jgi:hypothetical protein
MGFNPYRPQKRSIADDLFVASALVVCLGLLLWALFG